MRARLSNGEETRIKRLFWDKHHDMSDQILDPGQLFIVKVVHFAKLFFENTLKQIKVCIKCEKLSNKNRKTL